MRTIVVGLGVVAISVWASSISLAGDLVQGSFTRPACGKVCKLVCETKKLTAVGYGYECDAICIPGPSRRGCKHCDTTCCIGDDLEGCPPQIEFCWYDWFACGCAKPRTVKLLTKYQAEKEIGSYHWEVVDAACCDGVAEGEKPAQQRDIYKPAPVDAELGDVLAVSDEEWTELATVVGADRSNSSHVADQAPEKADDDSVAPAPEPAFISLGEKLIGVFKK